MSGGHSGGTISRPVFICGEWKRSSSDWRNRSTLPSVAWTRIAYACSSSSFSCYISTCWARLKKRHSSQAMNWRINTRKLVSFLASVGAFRLRNWRARDEVCWWLEKQRYNSLMRIPLVKEKQGPNKNSQTTYVKNKNSVLTRCFFIFVSFFIIYTLLRWHHALRFGQQSNILPRRNHGSRRIADDAKMNCVLFLFRLYHSLFSSFSSILMAHYLYSGFWSVHIYRIFYLTREVQKDSAQQVQQG